MTPLPGTVERRVRRLGPTLCGPILLLAFGPWVGCAAGQPAGDLTPAEKERRLDEYVRDFVRLNRAPREQPPPPVVQKYRDQYTAFCLERARSDYAQHGRWFHIVDAAGGPDGIRWDEVQTYRTFYQLLQALGGPGKIPAYSPENHRNAVAFWQGWQLEDGSFRNPLDERPINAKYVPEVLKLLEAQPLHPTTAFGGAVEIDAERFLSLCTAENFDRETMNHEAATATVIMQRINDGDESLIPVLECGIEGMLSQLNAETGMFHGDRPPRGDGWKNYGNTANDMKGLLRLVGYLGLENVPHRHIRADTLLANQDVFRASGEIAVIRNTAEMYLQCIQESPYRRAELLEALGGNAAVLLGPEPWDFMEGDYAVYAFAFMGSYLHWAGYDDTLPRTRWSNGVEYGWRLVVGPWGRCVSLVRKRPEEIVFHPDWNYEKYGLQNRNGRHEKRRIVEIAPPPGEWKISRAPLPGDSSGEPRFQLTRRFNLPDRKLDNPYLKIRWRGDIDVLVNGRLAARKLGGVEDWGGIRLGDEARQSLAPGENTLTILGQPGALMPPIVEAGLVDWTLRGADQ